MSRYFWTAGCKHSKVKAAEYNALSTLEECRNTVKIVTMKENLEKFILTTYSNHSSRYVPYTILFNILPDSYWQLF